MPLRYLLKREQMEITRDALTELTEITEDTVEYFCDKQCISGQLAWAVIETLATAKLAELAGELAAV